MVTKHIKRFTSKLFNPKRGVTGPSDDIIEVDLKEGGEPKKLALHMSVLERFQDTEPVLQLLRGGHKIVMVKISPLREKDMTELKRSINRLKTHCAATGGDLAAIDDNWIIIVPPSVAIEKT